MTPEQITNYAFKDPTQALQVLNQLDPAQTRQMAEIYQAAFGGPPWFEKFVCTCGQYAAQSSCSSCGQQDLAPAYPVDTLLKEYFPRMIQEFTPGVLLLATDTEGKLAGWSTGGFATLDQLISIKYQSHTPIADSIQRRCALTNADRLFYDNETCTWPDQQRKGIGRRLSQARVDAAVTMQAELICGRTINRPWLSLKEQQLTAANYLFQSFTPDGDTYQVDGTPRVFYLARRLPGGN